MKMRIDGGMENGMLKQEKGMDYRNKIWKEEMLLFRNRNKMWTEGCKMK